MSSLQKALIAVITILVLTVGYLFVHRNKATAPTETEVTPAPDQQQLTIIDPSSMAGSYEGRLPCADCEGIDQVLTLNTDGSYESQMTYLGKSTKPFVENGKWSVLGNLDVKKPDGSSFKGTVVTLNAGTDNAQNYLLNQNELKQLDRYLNEIDSPFNQTLTKKK